MYLKHIAVICAGWIFLAANAGAQHVPDITRSGAIQNSGIQYINIQDITAGNSVARNSMASNGAVADSLQTLSIDSLLFIGYRSREIVPPQTLAGAELQRLGSLSVSDALRYFSGTQIKDYGGIGGLKTVNVRSMGSQHVGVFYDGIQIGNAQNGTVDLGKFSLDNMELLSLYNGQKSDIFQSAKDFASASALYMVSRKPRFEAGRQRNINVKAKTGSFDLANLSALWEQKISDRVSTSANVEYLYTSGKYKFRIHKTNAYDTTEVRRNGDVRFLRAEAAAFGKLKRGEWQTKVYFYNSERGYPGAVPKEAPEFTTLNEARQRDRNFFVQSLLRQNISPAYSYRIQAKYANDYTNYVMLPQTTLKPTDTEYFQQELYLTAANLFTFNRWWTASLSADLQWNRLDANGRNKPYDTYFNDRFPEPRRYSVLGAAATSLQLEKVSIQGSLLYTFIHDISARKMTVAADKHIFTPSLIVSYKPWRSAGLRINAFYKNIFRMPTFNDLYYVDVGNRMLKPEYTSQYNIGASWGRSFGSGFLDRIDIQADLYYNEVKNKIIATPTSNQLVWTTVNLGYVEIRGADISVNQRFRIGPVALSGRLAYTYQRAQDLTPQQGLQSGTVDSFYGDQIPYIPLHSGSVVLGAVWGEWDFNYSFIYTGERYMLGGNVPVNYIQPWYTHDLSLSRNISLGRNTLKLSAEVNNIFNQQYEVVRCYPMPGTNFKVTASFTF